MRNKKRFMKRILSIQSNVVYGYAGNKVATFPMQLLGIEVMPVHTVQLSSSTIYPHYDGIILGDKQISRIINSLEQIGVLASIDAIISGYIGCAEQGEEIYQAVKKIKQYNPNAIYVCDPVMGGDINKGSSIPRDLIDFFSQKAVKLADYITPNLLELQLLSQKTLQNFDDVLNAVNSLKQQNTVNIIVKNLLHAGKDNSKFEMILANEQATYHLTRPLYDFTRRPIGVGDLICSTFTAHLVNGKSELAAFELAANIANDVLDITKQQNSLELEIIKAQHFIQHPQMLYRAVKI
ncbi:pyridoxal kinase [Frischella perrara]|jgi:pyridoxal kinase|uniref:pyridoxal kinase n=2 Tax=Frischella perrara TaxID=1267021 RepID=A0A318MZ84_FRIPE|nr:pyridoxal kinase [Frischella perrara]